ncbi:hypothetical protein E2320_000583, partial [Naja naja]
LMGGNKSSQCVRDLAVSKMVEGNTEPTNKCKGCPDPVPLFSCEMIEELDLYHLLPGEYPFFASAAPPGQYPSSFIHCHISPAPDKPYSMAIKELLFPRVGQFSPKEKNKEEEESAEKRGETLQNFKKGKERRAGCKMSNPENEKTSQINESFHPGQQPDPMKSAINPPPPMYQPSPYMPYQYQAYAGPPGAIPVQPQQTILITNVQAVNEPDYLGYSIFTLLCCCLPLGIAALIYSIQTQGANQRGDIVSAKKYSKVALILDHIALALGITSSILASIFVFLPLVGGNKSSQCGKDLAVSKMVEGNTEPRSKCRRCPDPVPVFSCEVGNIRSLPVLPHPVQIHPQEEESAEKQGEALQNFKEGKERRAGCEMSNPENEKTSQINESFILDNSLIPGNQLLIHHLQCM